MRNISLFINLKKVYLKIQYTVLPDTDIIDKWLLMNIIQMINRIDVI